MAEGSVGRSLFSRAPWIVFVHAMRRMGLSLRWHLVLGLLLMAYFVESAPATRPCSVSSSQWPVSGQSVQYVGANVVRSTGTLRSSIRAASGVIFCSFGTQPDSKSTNQAHTANTEIRDGVMSFL